jgi:uncharacterized protein (DUF305 family)
MAVGKNAHRLGSRLVLGLLLTLSVVLGSLLAVATPARASAAAPDTATAKFEIDFMKDMIDHHAMAVMMAEMCLEKAVHEELRALCEEIIATQSQEIATMQAWLQDWYSVSYAPEMTNGEMQQMAKLQELSGAEFEIAFMEMMIRHHRQAIREAERCMDRAYHGELVTLCQNIIEAQSAEIQQMQTWLCEWYGICKRS